MEKVLVYLHEYIPAQTQLLPPSHRIFTAMLVRSTQRQTLSEYSTQQSEAWSNALQEGTDSAAFAWAVGELCAQPDSAGAEFALLSLVIDRDAQGAEEDSEEGYLRYFRRLFFERLRRTAPNFELYTRQIEHEPLRKALRGYVDLHGLQRDLFAADKFFQFAPTQEDENCPIQEAARLLGEAVGSVYCASHQSQQAAALFELMSAHLSVEFLPFSRQTFLANASTNTITDGADRQIAHIAVSGVVDYIERHDARPHKRETVEIAKYLLLIFKTVASRLVSTRELVQFMRRKTAGRYSEEKLRQHIASLRDAGLLITSPQGRYGYKIPNTVADMIAFFNRYYQTIRPMLRRVQAANEQILLHTAGGVNVLRAAPEFLPLRELIRTLEQHEISTTAQHKKG